MPLLPAINRGGALYFEFQNYGDGQVGRQRATNTLRSILKFIYGDAYEYRFYGTSVQDGLITKSIVDRYNFLRNSSLTEAQAIAQIEASGSINISFVKRENPTYQYPIYYEYRIPPYDTTDRFLFKPLSIQNHKFNGCKLTGIDINIDSTQTTDGGPVVKVTKVNQNQIVFANNTISTAKANTSGLPARQLTSKVTAGGTGTISRIRTDLANLINVSQ